MQNFNNQNFTNDAVLFPELDVVYGGFWERFAAALIDGIILAIPNWILSYTIDGGQFGSSTLINIAINWLYFALQESGPSGATVGKKALGLKVTTVDGQPISFGQATGRFFGKYVSGLILCIGYLMMLWSDRKQTLHDSMAGTIVVKG